VQQLYGEPASKKRADGEEILRYPQGTIRGRKILLAITLERGLVKSISLGMIPLG